LLSKNSINFNYNNSILIDIADSLQIDSTETKYFTQKRFTAIALIILTGPLGGHRLYLGTNPVVPVFYALTLGGGFFILPVIDLISLIFNKNITKFENNTNVIMWINSEKLKE
jgi:hypothetical protein